MITTSLATVWFITQDYLDDCVPTVPGLLRHERRKGGGEAYERRGGVSFLLRLQVRRPENLRRNGHRSSIAVPSTRSQAYFFCFFLTSATASSRYFFLKAS
jgi:hypothetical protein